MIAAEAPLVQGYLLAKPMDPEDLTRWLVEEPRALPPAPREPIDGRIVEAEVADPGDTPNDVPKSEKS